MGYNALKKHIRPDIKGRISLGLLAKNVSSFTVWVDKKTNRIILEPNVEIPAKEKWLFDNEIALSKVKKGLKDSAANKTKSLGSFSKHIDDETE